MTNINKNKCKKNNLLNKIKIWVLFGYIIVHIIGLLLETFN